jgi:hypothetical protein
MLGKSRPNASPPDLPNLPHLNLLLTSLSACGTLCGWTHTLTMEGQTHVLPD